MKFIDSHCHINSEEFKSDIESFILRAKDAGVDKMVTVGTDLAACRDVIELAHKYADNGVYAAVGVHPHDAAALADDAIPSEIEDMFADQRVVAVGETGLDYFYDLSPRDKQRCVFRTHINAAKRVGKPISLHIRDAMDDALNIMREEKADEIKGVFHCYSGGLKYLEAALSFGYYISFAGPVTFAKNDEAREVARVVPIDKILCETDCPWLTPKPFRGKLNEPSYVRYNYETIAAVRNISVETLAEQVYANASALFGW